MSTTLDDGTVIRYVRDATGRIVQRIQDAPGTTDDSTISYLYSAGGVFATLNDTTLQQVLSLPGGVSVTVGGG